MRSYFDGMLRYFELSGRSSRMQYWMFFVIQFLLTVAAAVADFQLGGFDNAQQPRMPFTLFVAFVHFVPGITVGVRRLHDVGRSGLWYLLYFVPLAGLVVLYWACRASEPGRNGYDDPEPGSYEPHGGRSHSTIPRGVRMGNGAVRPPATGHSGLAAPQRFI